MSKNKHESAAERPVREKKGKEATPDFDELAKKLEEIKTKEAKRENEGHVKMTIYVEESLARSFKALITKRGQQKAFVNQALKDFVIKKSKELGM